MCPERLGIQLQLPQRAVALSAASLTGRMPGRPALLRALAKLSAHSWHVSATHMSLVCALLYEGTKHTISCNCHLWSSKAHTVQPDGLQDYRERVQSW